MAKTHLLSVFAAILFTPALAQAHYLWVTVQADDGKHGTAHVYFEESPRAGDGEYLDPFVTRGTSWLRTLDQNQPVKLPLQETSGPGNRWLSGSLPAGGPRGVESYGKWGVYRYGQTDVLLHYYARFLDVRDHETLHELARADHLHLDIVPHEANGAMEMTVLWQGKPAAGRDVFLRGPNAFKAKQTTDQRGRIRFEPASPGMYTVRTYVEELDKSGEFEGKTYQLVRHNATLTMQLPVSK